MSNIQLIVKHVHICCVIGFGTHMCLVKDFSRISCFLSSFGHTLYIYEKMKNNTCQKCHFVVLLFGPGPALERLHVIDRNPWKSSLVIPVHWIKKSDDTGRGRRCRQKICMSSVSFPKFLSLQKYASYGQALRLLRLLGLAEYVITHWSMHPS